MLSKEDLIKGAHKTTVVSTEKSTPTLSKTELINGSYPKRAFTSTDANQITTFYDTLSAYDKKYKSSNSTWGGIIKSNFDTYRNNGANFLEQAKDLEDIKAKASALQYMLKTTDFGSSDVGFFNLSGKAQVAKNEETKKQILDDINAMLKGENNIDTTINQLNNNYKIVNHNKASNEVSKFYNLLEKANQEGNYSYGNAQKTAEEKANIYTEIKAQAPIVKDAIQNLMIDDEQKNAMLDTIDEIINGENNIDTIIKSFEDMSNNYAQMSYDEFNKYEQAKYYSSAEYATEVKEKAHIVKLYEKMLDRYERSKWDDEIKRNNLKPGEAVVDIYSAGDELESMGISSKFLYEDLPKGVSPEKLLSVFEEKLYAKYNQLKGEVDSYEWYTDIDSAVESYKNGENTAYNKWVKDGSKDYSADLDDDYKKLENAPDVEWMKEVQNNYNEKFKGKLSEDERLVYNVKMHNARSDKERERITREFQEVINQRNAYETAESLKGHEWLSTLYSIYSKLGNWATGIKRSITGDETTTEGEYASGMVRQNLKETHGNAWASVYDVGSSVGQQLPSLGLALLTKGASNLIGKSVAQAKSLSGVVSASKLDKIAKISNTIGNITYKTAFGSSVAGNAYAEMKRAGYTETEAKTYALLSAASEVFLQDALGGIGSFSGKLTNKSINALVSNIDNAALRIATSGFIRAGGEFFEEALQEVLNPVYKTIITMDENIEPINWGDVLYSGALGSLTSIAMSAPSNIAAGTKYGFNTIKKIGYSLTDKGIKNLSVSNELYEFANSMPEYTLSNQMAQIVRKKGNAYNMLSELAYINKPLTTEQSNMLHDRLIEDGYTEEIANTIVDSAVKVSKGQSIPKIQKTAIESNTILSPAILDSIVQADSKMLGITEQYNNLYEDATPARNAVYENISNKITPKAETTQKATQTAEKAPATTKTENTTIKGREALKAPKNSSVKAISNTVLSRAERNGEITQTIADKIGKKLGRTVRIEKQATDTNDKGEEVAVNGYIDKKTGEIVISEKTAKTIYHELTHSGEGTKAYKNLVDKIRKTKVYREWLSGRTGIVASVKTMEAKLGNEILKTYQDKGLTLNDEEGIIVAENKEIIADFIADMIFNTKESTLENFVAELDKPTRNKFIQMVLNFLDKIKNLFAKGDKKLENEIATLERQFIDMLNNAQKETMKQGTKKDNTSEKKLSIQEIIRNDGHSYGIGVVLDSTLLTNLTDSERIEIVKEYIKELGGAAFTAFDKNGKKHLINIVKSGKKFTNHKGKSVAVNKDLSTKYKKSEIKQEAISLVDELILTSKLEKTEPAKYPHDWVDNYGKNDWEYWTTYIQDKSGYIWKAILNVATDNKNEKILYDISPIKKVGRSVKISDTIPTAVERSVKISDTISNSDSIEQLLNNVNRKNSISPETDKKYMSAVAKGDMETAQRMVERFEDKTPQSDYVELIDALKEQLDNEEITEEEYKAEINRLFEEAGKKYGTIEQGETVTGDENFENPVPKSVAKGSNVRRYARTVIESTKDTDMDSMLTDAQKEKILTDAKMSYVPTSNKENITKAIGKIARGEGRETWRSIVNGNKMPTSEDIAFGELLLESAIEKGDAGQVLKYTAELAEMGTRMGQAVQALSLLKRMGGLGQLYYVQQTVNTLNRDLEKRGIKSPKIKINEDVATRLAESKTNEDFAISYDAILQDVASQVPSTWVDKFNAWRYMAMLANPVTVIRNIAGNFFFAPVVMTSSLISKIAQKGVNTSNRTKAFSVSQEYKDFAKKSWQENKNAIMSGGKYNISSEVNEYRTIFKTKALEAVRKASGWSLDNKWFGDGLFVRKYYERALSGYLAARKIDLSKVSKETLSSAQDYAIKQALKNTYRDAGVVAQKLSELSRNPGLNILIEGVIPFKKTPINVFKRGIEYSPLGIISTIGKAVYELYKKKYSATDFIDGLANAFTGSGLFILGMWLSALGVANAGFDDEDELWRKLNGEQEYSLQFGDFNYTFDWMAPAGMPFFMGAAVYEDIQRNSNKEIGFDELLLSPVGAAFDVITENSMLQGISNLITNAKFAESTSEMFANIISSDISTYLMQYFPTILGKMANAIDDTKREYFVDKSKDGISQLLDATLEKISAKIPGLSTTRAPYVDAFGEEEKTGPWWQRVIQQFVSPGYISWDESTKLTNEITRLYKTTGDNKILPERAPKKIKFKGITKNLTEDEYYNYSVMRGQKNVDYLAEFVSNKKYKDLTDEQKAEVIKKLYEFSNAYAKSFLNYTYSDIKAMDIVDVDEATYNGYSKETKTALAKAYFLDSYGDEMKIERNGGSVVDYYINETIKKSKKSAKPTKKQNVNSVIKKYS